MKEETPAATSADWGFGDLEDVMEIRRSAQTPVGYSAIVECGDVVSLEVLDSAEKACEMSIEQLLPKRVVAEQPFDRPQHLPRNLKAAGLRLDKPHVDRSRDARVAADLAPLAAQWQREQTQREKSGEHDPQMGRFRWLPEELRVQPFAQELKTPVPVSVKRLQKMWGTMQW